MHGLVVNATTTLVELEFLDQLHQFVSELVQSVLQRLNLLSQLGVKQIFPLVDALSVTPGIQIGDFLLEGEDTVLQTDESLVEVRVVVLSQHVQGVAELIQLSLKTADVVVGVVNLGLHDTSLVLQFSLVCLLFQLLLQKA